MTDLAVDEAVHRGARRGHNEALLEDALTHVDWIKTGIVLAATVVLAVAVSKILRRVVARGIGHGFAAILTSRFLGYAVFIVGLSYRNRRTGFGRSVEQALRDNPADAVLAARHTELLPQTGEGAVDGPLGVVHLRG